MEENISPQNIISLMEPSYTGVPRNNPIIQEELHMKKKTMYTGVLYQNWIRNFCRTIGYPIVSLSKL